MNIEVIVLAAAVAILIGVVVYQRRQLGNNDVFEDLANKNEQLEKQVDALEKQVTEDTTIINDLLARKQSYDTMNKYIAHLENTIKNINDEHNKEQPEDE